MSPRTAFIAIGVIAMVTGGVIRTASVRMSATFDEIVLVGGGVRGVQTGRWDMITDQPPLPLWLYGTVAAPVAETLPPEDRSWTFDDRWDYARALHFEIGNDPQELLGRARWVTTLLAMLTVLAAGGFAWTIAGPSAGALGAALTALLPDVLAHGGVAYNDLPLAAAFLLAVWALDGLVRAPSIGRGAVAGLAVAFAFGMKMSALAVGPIAVLLLGTELYRRSDGRVIDSAGDHDALRLPDPHGWLRSYARAAVPAIGVSLLAAYLALVLWYRGDTLLTLFRFNVWRTIAHASGGHPAPAYLLGETSASGWWYYFPVALLFKTPAVFQFLGAGAGIALVRRAISTGAFDARALLGSRLRAPLLGVGVFLFFLMRSDLNAGFRYALPALPLLSVCVAVGASAWLEQRRARLAVWALVLVQGAFVLSAWPHFLSWSSVWAGSRGEVPVALSDSNVDWGQGLLELRGFMDEEGVDRVSLSYFGSARPAAYGIDYEPLPSFFRLDTGESPSVGRPRFTVISATNLHGLYLQGRDPFASYREREPYRVLGGALFIFDEDP